MATSDSYAIMKKAKVKAEWDTATDILVSSPGIELFDGILDYKSALFESTFDPKRAIKEHKMFQKVLQEEYGVNVHSTHQILLDNPEKLKELAEERLTYTVRNKGAVPFEELESLEESRRNTIENLDPESHLKIVIEEPTVVLEYQNKRFVRDHTESRALINQYFQRDPQITTDKGSVIGQMRDGVRRKENNLSHAIWSMSEQEPLLRIKDGGFLEGGDFVPAGKYALFGVGLRTNMSAIYQILQSDAIGYDEIAIVRDYYQEQDEMHLDTYLNFVASDKALILEDRIGLRNPRKIPQITTYQKTNNGYEQSGEENRHTLESYLTQKGVQLIAQTKERQLNYGLNILTMSENNIIAVKGIDDSYVKDLAKESINVREVDMTNLTKGYGGPHCMTQVFRRGE